MGLGRWGNRDEEETRECEEKEEKKKYRDLYVTLLYKINYLNIDHMLITFALLKGKINHGPKLRCPVLKLTIIHDRY